jgi:Tol biopolymer transport system component
MIGARRLIVPALLLAVVPSASAGEIVFTQLGVPSRIVVIDDDGSDRRAVAPGLFPAWSPNHSQIAYIARRRKLPGAGRVAVMSRSGRNRRALTGPGWLFPAWSPNGRWIVASCMGGCDAKAGLYLLDPDGTGRRRLTETRPSQVPSWGPGSKRVAFLRGRGSNVEVYVKTIGKKGARRLTFNDVPEAWLSWAPGGKLIAFTRGPDGSPDDPHDVWLMRADGTGQRRVTKTRRASEDTVDWAPRGGRLVFSTGRGLFTIEPDGTGRKKIEGTFRGDCCGTW